MGSVRFEQPHRPPFLSGEEGFALIDPRPLTILRDGQPTPELIFSASLSEPRGWYGREVPEKPRLLAETPRGAGLRSVALPVAIGITWFLSQNQNPGTLSLVVLLMALFLSIESRESVFSWAQSRFVILLVGALVILGLTTTLVAGGGLSGLRTAALAASFFLLGSLIGNAVGLRVLLLGLLAGATLVVLVGWWRGFEGIADGDFFTPGLYAGLTESEPSEFLTVLVGLGALLALSRPRIGSLLVWSPLFLLFFATAFHLGLIFGWLIAVGMVALWAIIAVLSKINSRRLDKTLGWTAATVGLLGLGVFVSRPLMSDIAILLGDNGALEIRFAIWDAVWQTVNLPGFLFGYGASFWGNGSPYGDAARDRMESQGISDFGHSHNAYLDFLIAFGLVGSLVALVLGIAFVRKLLEGWALRRSWEARSAPWIYFAALAVMGLTESAVVKDSTGWLFAGILVGAFLIADPYSMRGIGLNAGATRVDSYPASAEENRFENSNRKKNASGVSPEGL